MLIAYLLGLQVAIFHVRVGFNFFLSYWLSLVNFQTFQDYAAECQVTARKRPFGASFHYRRQETPQIKHY